MNQDKRCLGCGAILSLDKNEVGYTKNLEMDFCQACFRLKHYRQVEKHVHPNVIPKIEPNSLVLVVTSVMYLDLVFSYPIKRYSDSAKIVYVINQLDLLPHQTNYEYLYQRLRKEANVYHAPYEDILLMSSTSIEDIRKLREYIKTYNTKNVYLFGVQNSGKTTIFNALTNQDLTLTDVKAGLTQDKITKKVDGYYLHDLPGLFQGGYLHEIMPYEEYRKIIPLTEFKPVIYQVKEDQAFLINKFVSINYLKGSDDSIVFYTNNLDIKRVNQNNLKSQFNQVFDYTKTNFKLNKKKKYQITLADFGLVHLNGPATIEITYPKGLHISLKEAFFLWKI